MFMRRNCITLRICQIKMYFSLLVIFVDISRISYYAGEYFLIYIHIIKPILSGIYSFTVSLHDL